MFAEGTVGSEPPIGEGVWNYVSTADPPTCGWYGTVTFRISGQGTIYGMEWGPPWAGAVVGGTGDFAEASGEFVGVCGFDGFCRVTFELDD